MLFLIPVLALFSALFFYCQAFTSGLGRRRWAFAGFVFGPFVWPMFCMKKRMKVNSLFGWNALILRA
ncbi:hypothetical protein [Thalassotalea hakodatensis]|uniref:hypothetical protein n=1 Tax=Thalassotalea hakodatensis TaxID=3030492 RepID=UPI00257416A7|nr:hypothetical protein [Thalassotalea hakodatensis]